MRRRPFSTALRFRRAVAPRGARADDARPLDFAEIQQGLAELAALPSAEPIVLIGGVAGHFFGTGRLTSDIDVLALAPPSSLPNRGPLYIDNESMRGFTSHTVSGKPVDVLLPGVDTEGLVVAALRFARPHQNSIPIVTPEYWAVFKMLAARGKDEGDLMAVIGARKLDVAATAGLVKRFLGLHALHEFKQIAQMAHWQAGRTR